MKKRSTLKKFFVLAAAAAMTLTLCACSGGTISSSDGPTVTVGGSGSPDQPAGEKTYKVAIIKQMDHASLDEIANAVAAQLDKIAADSGVTIQYTVTSGQNGDQTILKQLADQAIADGVDAIIPIATAEEKEKYKAIKKAQAEKAAAAKAAAAEAKTAETAK